MEQATLHNYLNDGSTLEQLELALEAMSVLTSLCCETREGYELSPRRFSVLVDLVLLRIEQVYDKLKTEEEARRGQV